MKGGEKENTGKKKKVKTARVRTPSTLKGRSRGEDQTDMKKKTRVSGAPSSMDRLGVQRKIQEKIRRKVIERGQTCKKPPDTSGW